jgi:hypothetical protein
VLPGGAKFERLEDIADFWNEGFEPGKYWLTVQYHAGGMVSPKSAITILPMDVQSFSSFPSDGHLSSVLAHRRTDGRITLLQRESRVRDPREGVFVVREVLPDGPVAVATAIDVVPAGNGRWHAWSRNGSLTASSAWGDKVLATTPPVPSEGALLSPGFQVAVGTGLFGVVSPTGHLQTFLATRDGLKKHWDADLGSGPAAATGKILWNAQADGSIVVAWEDTGGRVMRRAFGSDGIPREGTPVAVTPGRPLAWGLPASGGPTIWALVGDGTTGLVLARIGLAGERSLARLQALSGGVGWDFLDASPGATGVVAAFAGDKLYSTRLDASGWSASEVPARSGAKAVHVVSLNGRGMWAEWIEPGFGIRRAKLP